MKVDDQFNIINDKLQQLLKQYARVRKENVQLKEQIAKQEQEKRSIELRVEELNQQISILKLSAGDMNEKDKKEFEKQINRYVKEIDKCISFLSA
jgi:chromosome segregation ATPase